MNNLFGREFFRCLFFLCGLRKKHRKNKQQEEEDQLHQEIQKFWQLNELFFFVILNVASLMGILLLVTDIGDH